MYYIKQKGFGPFKKWVLAEKVTPKHPETIIKDASKIIPNATITVDQTSGFASITFSPSGESVKNVLNFDVYTTGTIFTDSENNQGFVSKAGKIVSPDKGNSVITEVHPHVGVAILKVKSKKSGAVHYEAINSDTTLPITEGGFSAYSYGYHNTGLSGQFIILSKEDGKTTIMTCRGDVLSEDCLKYDTSRHGIFILSADKDGKSSTLQAYKTNITALINPTPIFEEKGVVDFHIGNGEFITRNPRTSTVYDIYENSAGEVKVGRVFEKEGSIENIAPLFCDEPIYRQIDNAGTQHILNERGNSFAYKGIDDLSRIVSRDAFTYVLEFDTKDGKKQGLFRNTDLAPVILPNYDRIKSFGNGFSELNPDGNGDRLVCATQGDTFEVYCVKQLTAVSCSTSPELVLNKGEYFNPQFTRTEGFMVADNKYGTSMVLDFNHRDNQPVASMNTPFNGRPRSELFGIEDRAQGEEEE